MRASLADLQRWPDLDWAQVCASIMTRLAVCARAGHDAKDTVEVLDKGKVYVNRILAARDAAERSNAELREQRA